MNFFGILFAIYAESKKLQRMIKDLEMLALRYFAFDPIDDLLNLDLVDLFAINANQMMVVVAGIELKALLAVAEIDLANGAAFLKGGKLAVDGGFIDPHPRPDKAQTQFAFAKRRAVAFERLNDGITGLGRPGAKIFQLF